MILLKLESRHCEQVRTLIKILCKYQWLKYQISRFLFYFPDRSPVFAHKFDETSTYDYNVVQLNMCLSLLPLLLLQSDQKTIIFNICTPNGKQKGFYVIYKPPLNSCLIAVNSR